MSEAVSRLISAWALVVKRGLSHWRLLSSAVIGVLLASAILAGSVIYFDALRELALKDTLDDLTETETDILIRATRGPTTYQEYEKVSNVVNRQIDSRIAWLLDDRVRGGKTATFFLTAPGNEEAAGDDNARSYFAFLPRLEQHITVLPGGRYPQTEVYVPSDEPLELEAIIPVESAERFAVGVGDRLSAVPFWTDAVPYATVVISGIFERNSPDEEFWHLDDTIFTASTSRNFRTVPFYVSEKAFMEMLGKAFREMDSSYAWLLSVDRSALNAGNASPTWQHIELMKARLGTNLFSYRQITSLEDALKQYDRRLFFSKLPMFIILVLIAVVVLYYVITLSSLLVEQQRPEIALLRSRGATSAQILGVFVLEGATISILAALAAPLLAATVISLLGYTPAFSELSGGDRLTVSISGGAYMMSALGGALSFIALIVPAIQASRIGVTRHRQQAARPSSLPLFQRYYLDVMLLVLAILLFRQLTEQGSVVATRLFGGKVVDQVLLAVPAVILVASAMVLLRLFPVVMALSSRLLSRALPVGLVMGLWQMARNPTHYARLSLLLILMAGLGIFAASFGGTLERSFEERALYSTGADIRVQDIILNTAGVSRSLVEDYEKIPGIEQVRPALRGHGSDLSELFGESYTMFAVDGRGLGEIARFRRDFSDRPMESLLQSLKHPNLPQGVPIPEGAHTIGVVVKADRPRPTVAVTARIRDSNDRYVTYRLGTLTSSDWSLLEAPLARDRSRGRRPRRLLPVAPLTLVSIGIYETDARSRLGAGAITIDSIRVRTTTGMRELERFDDTAGWNALRTASAALSDALQRSTITHSGSAGSATFVWSEGSALTSRGIYHGPPLPPLPVLASTSFIEETGHSIGEEFPVSVLGRRVTVRIVEAIHFFPTLDTINERFLISDVGSLSTLANLDAGFSELKPNEVWLKTSVNGVDRQSLIQRLEENDPFSNRGVHDRVGVLADTQADPLLKAGWRALLFIAFSAVLILSGLGFLVHAYVSFRSREVQFALMRTIGFSMKQLITLVWLEQALVIAGGMALGTWMGGRLGAIMMPFLGHDDVGTQVLPPFIIEVNWGTLALTYAAMSLLFALIIGGVIWFIHKISLQRILRLGEM